MTVNWRVVRLRAFRLEGEAEIHETVPVAFLGDRSWASHYDRVTYQSVLPEPIKAVGAQLGIAHRMHDVAVTEEVLQRAGVDAVIRQLEPAGMAQHVRMNREGQVRQFSSPPSHFEDPVPRHRPTAFGIEHMAAFQVPPPQLPKGPDLLPGERVRAVDTILGPPHMDTAAIKLDHIPGQFAQFAGA